MINSETKLNIKEEIKGKRKKLEGDIAPGLQDSFFSTFIHYSGLFLLHLTF
jgi:hypothetical protein